MKKIVSFTTIFIVIISVVFSIIYFYRSSDKVNREITKVEKNDINNLIVVSSPIKDSEISSPLSIAGRARGVWFFEGSFPIVLLDKYRNIIAEGHVTAQGQWMTQDFVKFLGTLQFNNYIKGSNGFLILKKDNPSGLPENDNSIEIPIIFK